MMHMGEAAVLAATMTDRLCLWRQAVRAGAVTEDLVYDGLPCALSRSAHTASPSPMGMGAVMAESVYRMSLFMPAGTVTRLGDRVEIARDGQIFRGSASDSVGYPSHSVCVAEVRCVTGEEGAHD